MIFINRSLVPKLTRQANELESNRFIKLLSAKSSLWIHENHEFDSNIANPTELVYTYIGCECRFIFLNSSNRDRELSGNWSWRLTVISLHRSAVVNHESQTDSEWKIIGKSTWRFQFPSNIMAVLCQKLVQTGFLGRIPYTQLNRQQALSKWHIWSLVRK
jgi:hypothetical protein